MWLKHITDSIHSGQTLSIKATGTLKEDVDEGAYADIVVKYGLITLLRTQINLCEEVQKVDMKCPLKAGKMTLTKDVELPKQIPPVCCIANDVMSKVLTKNRESIPSPPTSSPRIRRTLPASRPRSLLHQRVSKSPLPKRNAHIRQDDNQESIMNRDEATEYTDVMRQDRTFQAEKLGRLRREAFHFGISCWALA